MIIGLGIDLVEVGRIAETLVRFGGRFEERVFSAAERVYCGGQSAPALHYAARFAAKEAFFKALGTGKARGMCWTEVGVRRGAEGRPTLVVSGRARELMQALGASQVHLSLTHTPGTAAAVVILEK